MRIAIVTNYWFFSEGGGLRTFIVNLVEALIEKEMDVKVIFREGVDLNNYKGNKNKILFVLSSLYFLKKIRPEVIHTQGTWYCLLPGVLYKKINECVLIHTFNSEPTIKMSRIGTFFFQILLNSCNNVVFGAKGLKAQFDRVNGFYYPKSTIILGGVKSGKILEEEISSFRAVYLVNQKKPIILVQAFTATSLKAKGLKIVFNAVVKLLAKYPQIAVIVTRDGKEKNDLFKYAEELNINEHIIFTGDLNNPYVPIELCDIFIFPWLGSGGFGMALLEAMSVGKPCIIFDCGYESEVIVDGENGLLSTPDSTVLAEKIDLLITNHTLSEKIATNGKKTVIELFTWKQVAENYIKSYEDNQWDG